MKTEKTGLALLGGVGLGALLMYVFDPQRGARRRALARDKAVRAYKKTGEVLGAHGRDLANRSRGAAAKTRSLLKDEPVSDVVLAERVRARIGRSVDDASPLEISARGGIVTILGPVDGAEVEALLAAIRDTPGVEDVQDRLEVRGRSADIPGVPRRSRGERETF